MSLSCDKEAPVKEKPILTITNKNIIIYIKIKYLHNKHSLFYINALLLNKKIIYKACKTGWFSEIII